jgi:L-ascorbate metabolism protein UlaG (beta-lactamase superfamily)
MALSITYLGHSGFLLSDGRTTVAIDPFLTGNPVATLKPESIACDAIVVTHAHEDHFGDTPSIAKRTNATVFCGFELGEHYLMPKGISNVELMNPGGRVAAPWGWVALTQAFHSSSIEGQAMGSPCGAVIHLGGVTVWHLGDTGLFGDMKLLGEVYRPRVACIPIGDRFTMGPELATRAAELIAAPTAIPMHYNTWPPIAVDVGRFRPEGIEVAALRPGERFEVR